MFILGFGSATAQNKVTTSALLEAGAPLCAEAPTTRSSIIAGSFFDSPKNRLLNSEENATTLGKDAMLSALNAAKLDPESLGLLIGDTATSKQTTPSEGQRVGCTLKLKVPSYDVTGAAAANLLHLDIARKWKTERLPEYSCFFSSSALTHAVDFTDPQAQFFGDGASAVILSVAKKGRFKLLDTSVKLTALHTEIADIKKFGGLHLKEDSLLRTIRPTIHETLRILHAQYAKKIAGAYLVLNQLAGNAEKDLAISLGFAPERILSLGTDEGDLFGANPFAVMTKYQNIFKKGDAIFLTAAGIGVSHAYALLSVEE